MATGRTLARWMRPYTNGRDISSGVETIGPLSQAFGEAEYNALDAEVKGVLPNQVSIGIGSINGIFDTGGGAPAGIHYLETLLGWNGLPLDVMLPLGIRAVPAAGDPVFCGKFNLVDYKGQPDGDKMIATLQFGAFDVNDLVNYIKPWGTLLHAKLARTGANASAGIDDWGAETYFGGFMAYQIFATGGGGTGELFVEDSDDNDPLNFDPLVGATTGTIAFNTITAGMVGIGISATVRRYLRWQLTLAGGATSCQFALAFVRGLF